MITVYGSRLYGKVDWVPGEFYVATEFFHANFITVWPQRSWLIFHEAKEGWYGVRIPMSLKSVAIAYLRCACTLWAVVLGLFTMLFVSAWAQDGHHAMVASLRNVSVASWAIAVLVAAAGVFLTVFSRWVPGLGRATAARAEQLARAAGLPEQVIEQIVRRSPGERAVQGFEVLAAAPRPAPGSSTAGAPISDGGPSRPYINTHHA